MNRAAHFPVVSAKFRSIWTEAIGRVFAFFLPLFLIPVAASKAQAPASLSGSTIGLIATSGTAPFADSGYAFIVVDNFAGTFQIAGLSGFNNSLANYAYSTNAAVGHADWTDDAGGNYSGDFSFGDAVSGSYVFTDNNSGSQQDGDFILFTGNAPDSLSGKNLACTINDGSGQFAATGQATFSMSSGGNSYWIQGDGMNVQNSSGTYSYSKQNNSSAKLQLNDSIHGQITMYLAFGDTADGSFGIQTAGGDFQIGDFSTVDLTPPTIAISAPLNNQRLTNEVFNITGQAADNAGIALVMYSLNNGADWFEASSSDNNWTDWNAYVVLTPGTNVLSACAVDSSGNVSATNTVQFYYAVMASLRATANNANNHIYPDLSGTALEVGKIYNLTAQAAPGFVFTNWTDGAGNILTNKPGLTFAMQSGLILTANFVDVAKPSLVITSPKSFQRVSNNVVTIYGKSFDNDRVFATYLSLNGSSWFTPTAVNSSSNWLASVNLIPGTNHIAAYAVDFSGNISAINTVDFVYVPCSILTVNAGNGGKISPALNGSLLPLGQRFSITATPKTGFAFQGWTDAFGNVPTNKNTLSFIMASNLTYTATFVDTSRPVLNLQVKQSNLTNYSEQIRIQGKATDNDAVGSVCFSFNNSAWTLASYSGSWSNWWADLTLVPGVNSFAAYAVDRTGNSSPVSQIKITLQTAPASLTGLSAQFFIDLLHSREYTFSSKFFGQVSDDPDSMSGAGSYVYTKTAADSGKIQLGYTSPPKAAGLANKTFYLHFITTKSGQYTSADGSQSGGFTMSPISEMTMTSLVNKAIYYFGSQGDGKSTYYYSGKNYNTNLIDGSSYAGTTLYYSKFSPVTTILKQTNASDIVYIVTRYISTNYGIVYTEHYWPSGAYRSQDAGFFGISSINPSGTAPNNLNGRNLLVGGNGATFNVDLLNDTFSQQSFSSDFETGVGNYYYNLTGFNSASLSLNYSAPIDVNGGSSQANITFYAANLGYITNPDNTVNAVVLRNSGNFANGSWIGRTLQFTNTSNGATSTVLPGYDGNITATGSQNFTAGYTWSNYSGNGDLLPLNFYSGSYGGNSGYLQLNYNSQNSGAYKISVFDGANNLLSAEQGVFGQQ